jgi:hypothetical protein
VEEKGRRGADVEKKEKKMIKGQGMMTEVRPLGVRNKSGQAWGKWTMKLSYLDGGE